MDTDAGADAGTGEDAGTGTDTAAGVLMARRIAEGADVARALGLRHVDEQTAAGRWFALDFGVRRWGRPERLPAPAPGPSAADGRGGRPLRGSELALALCHPDGRVREAALDRIAADHAELLPLVVIRCADWARPVRERARALLPRLLAQLPPAEVLALVPVALRGGLRERGGWAQELIVTALGTLPGRDPARRLRVGADLPTRRLGARLTVAQGHLPAAELAALAAADRDVVVQRLYADAALAALPEAAGRSRERDPDPAGVPDAIAPLLAARPAEVRAAGVTALHRAGRPDLAPPYLLDRSPLVRACARWVLRQYGTDPRPLYRDLCTGPAAVPRRAPVGLGECRTPGTRARDADAAVLTALLAHPDGLVRADAVTGLRLLGRARPESMLPLVDDPSPSVVREATRALLPFDDRLPDQRLRQRLDPAGPEHRRRAAARLLSARYGGDPWAGTGPADGRRELRAEGAEATSPAAAPTPVRAPLPESGRHHLPWWRILTPWGKRTNE
ncbi:hypothetical protein [Streptomyces sp. NRRL S-87]|uniref:hypothetical protein n=1 Tax=Streptomyces sp. NRRL S-87 TaxID=1463920 RepID=UPI00068E17CB|nr:hypothetical protein [Streptomyces sp. NRRL S-87]